jgi:hypothetical protein
MFLHYRISADIVDNTRKKHAKDLTPNVRELQPTRYI